jgi:uncharacterized membrane protein
VDLINLPFRAFWQGSAFVVVVPAVVWATWTAPWRRFDVNALAHVWFGAIFFLTGLWSIKASLASGLVFHLLGVSLFTLLAGPQLALIGTALVVALVTVLRDGSWANYALAVVAMGAVPVIVTTGVLRAAERWLAPNMFVYIFVVAFFGPALAMLASGLLLSAAAVLAGALPAAVILDQFLPYLIYLAFGEATMTGMLITLLVVYQPTWVATFDDARYLRGR